MNGYWVGPYAPGGSGIFGGFIDYVNMINARDGGVNGVKLTYEKCETEYNNARGVECYERQKKKGPTGATLVHPLSTGITYSLIEKGTADKIPIVSVGYGRTDASDGRVFPYVFPLITNYWSQNTAKIKFIGSKEGGMDKLKGKKIVNIYHDSAYGKETIPVLDAQAKKYGFAVTHIAGAASGQRAGRAVAADPPDQARLGDPARLGRDEPGGAQGRGEDRLPARSRSSASGGRAPRRTRFPRATRRRATSRPASTSRARTSRSIQEIKKHVYAKGKGEMDDETRIGSIYYNRGVVHGILTVEAIRKAQEKYGKKPLTGEQIRWGLENLHDQRSAPEGARRGRLHAAAQGDLRWTTKAAARSSSSSGTASSGRSSPTGSSRTSELVRPMIEQSAAAYAKEKNITPRDCSKES